MLHSWVGSQIDPRKPDHELWLPGVKDRANKQKGISNFNTKNSPSQHAAGNDVGLRNIKNGTKGKQAFSPLSLHPAPYTNSVPF